MALPPSKTPIHRIDPASELSKHAEEVLLEIGCDREKIAALKEQKVIF